MLVAVACSNGGGGGGGDDDDDAGSSDECVGGPVTGGPGATISNVCLASSSGTSTIEIGDIIRFEVSVTAIDGQEYNPLFWSLSGDTTAAAGSTAGSGWAGVSHTVTGWTWHYQPAGSGTVDMGFDTPMTPTAPVIPVPDRLVGSTGYFDLFGTTATGDGVPSLVGTVTIQADAAGTFTAGGMIYPGVDGFLGSAGADPVTVSGGSFTVTP